MIRLGKKIKELRRLKNLTQKEFSKAVQITYRHFQNIEADKTNIRISTAEDIALGLKVPVQTLFDQNHDIELLGMGLKDAWQIIELFPVGIFIVNLDGKIVYFNSFFKSNFLDHSKDQKLKDFFVWDLLPPANRAQGKLDFLKVIREKLPPKPGRRFYLGPGKKEVEVTIYWNYIYDDHKTPMGFISSVAPLN